MGIWARVVTTNFAEWVNEMNKKMIAMIMALVFIVSNTSMAYALSPVAEVYYNAGTSIYDSSNFESQLNDAIKAKLVAGGVNPKYVSIMDASANPTSVTDPTYVHTGRDSWYIGTTPEVETADYNHVQIFNSGKTFTFYGYTAPAYKDFMLTNGSPSGKKKLLPSIWMNPKWIITAWKEEGFYLIRRSIARRN